MWLDSERASTAGLEATTQLSEALGDSVAVTLIDKSDSFMFGYSKLDVLFGRSTVSEARLPYREFVKPGVRFLQQTVTAIDPVAKRVTTDAGVFETDQLIIALGAWMPLPVSNRAAMNSTQLPALRSCERSRRPSLMAKLLSVFVRHPSNVRRHPVNAPCVCTIVSANAACESSAKSAS